VTRAMAGGLRRPWRAAEEQGREGRRMRRCFCLCHRVENNAKSDSLIQRHLTPQSPLRVPFAAPGALMSGK
ncbi:hypothetical protein XENOCAPTIV_012410, partial [Xenoophorus captivus]